MKKLGKALLAVLLVLVLAVGGLIGWLSATEYRPEPTETLSVRGETEGRKLEEGASLRILSWNIGYAGLGKDEDFFMDGGKSARPSSNAVVNRYLNGICETIEAQNAALCLLQEVDSNSHRTFGIDERTALQRGSSVYALNYSCPFVPVPVPPIGKVNSGLFTLSSFPLEKAERISLPCPFSWPMRTVNLKRCLLVSYLPIENSDRQLVLVNLHLEAYDEGEGKIAQTNQLRAFIESEYAKGNYVIAGGDFNQTFPGGLERYPIRSAELWTPGVLDQDLLGEGWQYACDLETPSCRLLDRPYDPADPDTQYYVIDGFILSPNVTLESVQTVDEGFENSDHNPVLLTVTLG